eukprot:Platyproteum_vivax@DN16137_c0_g1_i1.p1
MGEQARVVNAVSPPKGEGNIASDIEPTVLVGERGHDKNTLNKELGKKDTQSQSKVKSDSKAKGSKVIRQDRKLDHKKRKILCLCNKILILLRGKESGTSNPLVDRDVTSLKAVASRLMHIANVEFEGVKNVQSARSEEVGGELARQNPSDSKEAGPKHLADASSKSPIAETTESATQATDLETPWQQTPQAISKKRFSLPAILYGVPP